MTSEQKQEMMNLKKYFPFRIVWSKINKDTGEFESFADKTKAKMNKAVREGHQVFILEYGK